MEPENNLQCGKCSEMYVMPVRVPRSCRECGSNICTACLLSIKQNTGVFECALCHSKTAEIWPKNLALIKLFQPATQPPVCCPHSNKIISFCCSPTCKMPPGICSRSDCSRTHAEFGSNCLPAELVWNTENFGKEREYLHEEYERVLLEGLASMREKAMQRVQAGGSAGAGVSFEKVFNMPSHQLASFKKEFLKRESRAKERLQKVLQEQQQRIQKYLLALVLNYTVRYDVLEKQKKKAEQIPIMALNNNAFFFSQMEIILEYQFHRQKIFDSQENSALNFKNTIRGRPNLIFKIELQDGNIIGCYISKQIPTGKAVNSFVLKDEHAFIYWQNLRKYFVANPKNRSQFDLSPEYLLSIGNTQKWDGIWLVSDFSILNPGSPKDNYFSSQAFLGMSINTATNRVKKVEVYQLTFL